MTVIRVAGARKSYRRRGRQPELALNDLDLVVQGGGVHGFLGPNGSGKTTTIRMLLGLVRADAGEVRLFERQVPDALSEVIGQVGALVETPLFLPQFTGRLNLRLLAVTAGVSISRVDECLELVGLRERGLDRFKTYSLGMKQRLGIAAALLKEPRLLILDEPSNGLDPAGIREVRELIGQLGRDGRTTVFLSSHMLSEVQQVCDDVSIMAQGRCVASGSVRDLLGTGTTGDMQIRVSDQRSARVVLESAGYTVSDHQDLLRVHGVTAPSEITRELARRHLYLSELSPIANNMEDVFIALTSELK